MLTKLLHKPLFFHPLRRQCSTIKPKKDLKNWKGCQRPERKIFEGYYVRLEPINAEKHVDDLYEISCENRLKYLWENVETRENLKQWLLKMEAATDPIMFVIINKETGKAEGRQSYWNIDEKNGVAEIGHALRGPNLEGKPGSTEAFILYLSYVFEDLGYRRMYARTHHKNSSSQKMITRYGLKFEGVLRQHGVKKGANQDSYIYSVLDYEWPFVKRVAAAWYDPSNFDENGKQKLSFDQVKESIMAKKANY